MKYSICLFLLLSAAASATPEQTRLFFGHDDRRVVSVDTAPWQSLGQVRTASGSICTGSMVAPDVVLTAGHCFFDQGHFDPAVSFSLGLDGEHSRAVLKVSHVHVERRLFRGLRHVDNAIIIDPAVAAYDFAFVRLAEKVDSPLLPLFAGDAGALSAALKKTKWRVTQAGYAIDSPRTLKAHADCRATGLRSDGRLTHHCDTLPGDSGSPLLARVDDQWQLVAIQSSAPDASDRQRADNMALSVPVFSAALRRFLQQGQP